jgi:hypothetical protein
LRLCQDLVARVGRELLISSFGMGAASLAAVAAGPLAALCRTPPVTGWPGPSKSVRNTISAAQHD